MEDFGKKFKFEGKVNTFFINIPIVMATTILTLTALIKALISLHSYVKFILQFEKDRAIFPGKSQLASDMFLQRGRISVS